MNICFMFESAASSKSLPVSVQQRKVLKMQPRYAQTAQSPENIPEAPELGTPHNKDKTLVPNGVRYKEAPL